MADPGVLKLLLTLSAPGYDDERLDDLTHLLLSDLKDLNMESAQLVSQGDLPAGAKGVDPVTAGAIAIAVLPAMLPKVVEFLQSWTLQGRGRTIKFKGKVGSRQIEFEGSLADMEKLLEKLEKEEKKKK